MLRRALETGQEGAIVAAWLAAEGQPLPPVGTRALISALAADEAQTRVAAAWALARAGAHAAPAREALTAALRRDGSTGVRVASAAALGAMGAAARPAVPELFASLGDASEAVRHAVARALSRLPLGPEDVEMLLDALESRDDYVSAFAAWTLGNMGDGARAAVPALVRALKREKTNAVVSGALARIGPAAAKAVPVLLEALRSPDADRRWRAARTLAGSAPPHRRPSSRSSRPWPTRTARCGSTPRALGHIGAAARPAAGALQRATADPDRAIAARPARRSRGCADSPLYLIGLHAIGESKLKPVAGSSATDLPARSP